MLYTVAGCRLYIADHTTQPGVFPISGWVEIAELEAIGALSTEWDIDAPAIVESCGPVHPVEFPIKTVERRAPIALVMGVIPSDPGQLLLWEAAHSRQSYPFRLVFPDGATTRRWFALVTKMGDTLDTANSLIKLQADLKPTSPFTRSS